MRGVFTCGVLDFFMDNGIRFPFTVGAGIFSPRAASWTSSFCSRISRSGSFRMIIRRMRPIRTVMRWSRRTVSPVKRNISKRKYPHLQEAMRNRNAVYNRTMELVELLEASGDAIVIRPEKPIEVGRMEKDTAKLTALYEEGYHQAARKLSI